MCTLIRYMVIDLIRFIPPNWDEFQALTANDPSLGQ